ncbi:AAA family ATPase, partial [Candidatus Parcubacteria bacterium]|nr:AAA family ATPase [Candidatus Parcubacteria bacterium]
REIPSMLRNWNLQNKPPMHPKELRSVFESLARKEGEKNPVVSRERKMLSVKEAMEMTGLTELFLVDKLIPREGITALSGHPGSGKSWVSLHIAECVAKGSPLFGLYKTEQGAVLIVDEESGVSEYGRRWKKLATDPTLPIRLLSKERFKLDNKADLEELKELVVKNQIKLIIFDPFVAMHSKAENSADEIQSVMSNVQELTKLGATVLYIHHHRKDGLFKGNRSQGMRGSSAFSGINDSHLVVEKENVDNELKINIYHEKSRRGETEKGFSVKLVNVGEEGIRIEFGEELEEQKLKKEQAKDAILEIIEGGDKSRQELIQTTASLTKVGDRTIKEAIKELLKAGLMSRARIAGKVVYKPNESVQSL